jgi:hypothetical protein
MLLPTLRFMSVNVARHNARLHAILNKYTDDLDIIFVQEPWFGRRGLTISDVSPEGIPIFGTQSHRSWLVFEPISEDMPKCLTLVKHGVRGLQVKHAPGFQRHAGFLALEVSYGGEKAFLVNIYNRGKTGIDRRALDLLRESEADPMVPTVVARDFNLHHGNWSCEYHVEEELRASRDLVEWADEQLYQLQNQKGEAT